MGDGHAVVIGSANAPNGDPFEAFQYGAYGGHPGEGFGPIDPLPGGEAFSRSIGTAEGDSSVIVRDRAVGGVGYSAYPHSLFGGSGGGATSHAEGRNAGAAPITVVSTAIGGGGGTGIETGGRGGAGGVADAGAAGFSTGGGQVDVLAIEVGGAGGPSDDGVAIAGDGAHELMTGNVSGGTTGLLALTQRARAGNGGEGGTAQSELAGVNQAGGDLAVLSEALGGDGTGIGGHGGTAIAFGSGFSDAGDTIDASARAIGGKGGDGRDGVAGTDGAAASALAQAGGTQASVLGAHAYGEGGAGGNATSADAGSGGSVSLADAVSVDAPSGIGSIRLEQHAVGGHGGSATNFGAAGIAGNGGSASSTLMPLYLLRGSVAVDLDAIGGAAGDGSNGGRGGDATASAQLAGTNGALLELVTHALAGNGGVGIGIEGASGDGATATLSASAQSSDDLEAIYVAPFHPGELSFEGARGGNGADGVPDGAAGNGGDATSTSSGIGHNDVFVYDRARAGAGGFSFQSGPAGPIGGRATSSAYGESAGNHNVTVVAEAIGGAAGFGGGAGDASADAHAIGGPGSGTVSATANAMAGVARAGGGIGVAQALAEASGPHAISQALAATTVFRGERLGAATTSDFVGGRSFASVGFATAAPGRPPGASSTVAIAHPLAADVDAAFAPGSNVRNTLSPESLVLGELSLTQTAGSAGDSARTIGSFTFSTNLVGGPGGVDLGIGLNAADVLALGSGFQSLELTVHTGPTDADLFDVELNTAEAVQAFFADRLLLLPGLQDLKGPLQLSIDLILQSSVPGTSFASSILVGAVPEPSPFAAVVCALAVGLLVSARRKLC